MLHTAEEKCAARLVGFCSQDIFMKNSLKNPNHLDLNREHNIRIDRMNKYSEAKIIL